MSNLLRCDKCKCELPTTKTVKRKILSDLTIYENYYTNRYVSNRFESKKDREIHLCKKCLEKFEMWLDE